MVSIIPASLPKPQATSASQPAIEQAVAIALPSNAAEVNEGTSAT